MKPSSLAIAALIAVFAAVPAFAQPTVDGTLAGDSYGGAASVQAVETGFGDNQSELNAAYCTMGGSRLYLVLTGNIENNFNKIEIFIDSKAGGENVFSGVPGNDGAFRMTGMRFDPGFEADYHLIARRGNSGGDRFDLDFAELGTPNFSSYGDIFGGSQVGSGATGTGLNTQPIEVAYDDSNVGGVAGGNGAANQAAALAVQTGLELSIALADLGSAGGDIRVLAFVDNQDHNFASNQFLGPLAPPQVNMGGDGAGTFTGVINFDLGNFAGEQFFTCAGRPVPAMRSTWGRIKTNYR
jgi:hypothetical protein